MEDKTGHEILALRYLFPGRVWGTCSAWAPWGLLLLVGRVRVWGALRVSVPGGHPVAASSLGVGSPRLGLGTPWLRAALQHRWYATCGVPCWSVHSTVGKGYGVGVTLPRQPR